MDEFCCYKDEDVEQFLRKRATNYVKQQICSVYLFLDEDLLKERQEIFVLAYFALSHKAIELTPSLSVSKRKTVTALKTAEMASCILVGQLAKYMAIDDSGNESMAQISSDEILDSAIRIAIYSNDLIASRAVLVETKFEEKLYKIYQDYGFKPLQISSSGNFKQFYLRLRNKQLHM